MANLNVEPGDEHARRDDRVDRARRAHAHQRLVVDRRLAQQVPVRLRVGRADRERQAQGRGEEPELPRRLGDVLAQPARCVGEPRHVRSAWHAVLRQGRAEPGDPRRPRVAGRACSRTSRCSAARRERRASSIWPIALAQSSCSAAKRSFATSPASAPISCASTTARCVRRAASSRRYLSLRLIRERAPGVGERSPLGSRTTSRCARRSRELRDALAQLPEDPWLLHQRSAAVDVERAPRVACRRREEVTGHVIAAARRAATSSASTRPARSTAASRTRSGSATGTRSTRFNFDWSLYLEADKAVKDALRGLRLGPSASRRRAR